MIPKTFIQHLTLRREIENMNKQDQKIALAIYRDYWHRLEIISNQWITPMMLGFLSAGLTISPLLLIFGRIPWFAGLLIIFMFFYFLVFTCYDPIHRKICSDYYQEKEQKQKIITEEICTDSDRKRIFEIMREVFNSRKNTFE